MDNEAENKKIINGVEVIEDGDITHFHPIDDKTNKDKQIEDKPASFWDKILNWFKTSKVKPYIKIRDAADPFYERRNSSTDADAGSDGKFGAEIGIKVDF